MTFNRFIECAKKLHINQEYPYLPSSKSSGEKKYKLLEVSENSIKISRGGENTSISISHIKTLLENMKQDIPLDVEKVLGSGGNTRSIEEAILCLMPTVYYTRINNRKHIIESSKMEHSLGKIEEWHDFPDSEDLGLILRKMYNSAADTNKVLSIHLFGIKYGSIIIEKKIKLVEIIKYAGLNDSYTTEINKGVNIYKYLKLNPDFISSFIRPSGSVNAIVLFKKDVPVSFSVIELKKNYFSPRYITSLLAKPFVILTGNSGTGKTRIARRFAEYLKKESESGESNILVVPVGADWTDNTKILGYFNPLADDGAGVYVKTEIFRFLERANTNPQIPFFLILDEMNLSHVERYFSDFLSKMEIPGSVFEIDGYGSLPYPKNLFVTGTVNIDETTYMFSPKVLDRANVIEFKPEKDSVLTSLTAETEEDSSAAEPGMAEGFLQLAEKIRNAPATDYNHIDFATAEPVLSELYDILQKAGFEFAFRTVKEIRQYLIAAYELAEEKESFTLNGHLDIQILQKILPKIYGNRQQVGTLLEELKAFFEKENFTHSLQKVTQMAERLSRFQFVSFV